MCFHLHLNEANGSQPKHARYAHATGIHGEVREMRMRNRVLRHVTHAKIDFNKATTLRYTDTTAQYAKSAWLAY